MLSDLVFPKDILLPLKRYLVNPKASTAADILLSREVRKYDLHEDDRSITYLSDIKIGEQFTLRGRRFQKEGLRRTRVLCLEIKTGRKYLISGNAEVEEN